MEVVIKKSYNENLKPLDFKIKSNGCFSLELSILNQVEYSNNFFVLTLFGFDGKVKREWGISFRLEFREMCVIEENGIENWFIPSRFGLKRIQLDDKELGKGFIDILQENNIDCNYNNLKDFVGFEIEELNKPFQKGEFENSYYEFIATNGKQKSNKDYLELSFKLNYPEFRLIIEETEVKYREKMFEFIFEK